MCRELAAALLTVCLLATAAQADTIHLKSGGVMRNARVLAEAGDTVTVEIQVGKSRARVVLARGDILKIERDAPPEPTRDPSGRPRRPDGLGKAFALLQKLRPVEAEVQLQPFLQQPQWQAEARYALSLAREQTGDLDGAEKQQRLASLLDPKHPWVKFHGAHLTHRRGKLRAAISAYVHALALDPENPRLRAAVRAAIGAAKAGRVPHDPAVQRQRRDFDPKAGNVGDAAAAAKAVRGNAQLELRTHVTGLRVLLDAPPGAVRAYAAGGDVAGFRESVGGLRAVVQVNAAWLKATPKQRSMCLRQIHSALGHRYPFADTVVEAFVPVAGDRGDDGDDGDGGGDGGDGANAAGATKTTLAGAAWFWRDEVRVRLWPIPDNG